MEKDKSKGVFRSVNGDVSSKRVAGFVLIISGIVISIVGVVINRPIALDAAKPMIYSGMVSLGAGTIERFGKNGIQK